MATETTPPPEQRDPQLLKGVLPMLVLALLTERESYGYELVVRLQEVGLADITTGTVYPVLTRLERDGHVSSRLVASPSGPARKYYLPTPDGTVALDAAVRGWERLNRTVTRALAGTQSAGGQSAGGQSAGTQSADAEHADVGHADAGRGTTDKPSTHEPSHGEPR